jgi:hypothetical protein
MNCIRRDSVVPSPDFTSWVSRASSQGRSASSAGSTSTAPRRSRLAFASRIMSVMASISGWPGASARAGQAGPVERLHGLLGEGDAARTA